jgi:predicted O-methyltransferase YrrM
MGLKVAILVFYRMSIVEYFKKFGVSSFYEGHSHEQQAKDLIELTKKPGIDVMEIGFNAGHSADTFLKHNSQLTLTSFDIGGHGYVLPGKTYIDTTYPNRHTLVLGDSRSSVPNYIRENNGKTFDVIFIDGGHAYEVISFDIENCKKLSHKDTIVIIDDVVFNPEFETHWTLAPSAVCKEYIETGKLKELGRAEYCIGRGMIWGNYIF